MVFKMARVRVNSLATPHTSPVVLHMLYGVDDFVDQLERDAWDDAFGLRERTLEGAQRDPSFLCRHARE